MGPGILRLQMVLQWILRGPRVEMWELWCSEYNASSQKWNCPRCQNWNGPWLHANPRHTFMNLRVADGRICVVVPRFRMSVWEFCQGYPEHRPTHKKSGNDGCLWQLYVIGLAKQWLYSIAWQSTLLGRNSRMCLLLLRTFVHSMALFGVRKGFQFQMILSYSL